MKRTLTAIAMLAMTGLLAANGEAGETAFSLWRLVKPLGALTFFSVLATATLGFLMARGGKKVIKWHHRLAYLALAAALSHVSLVALLD